MVQNYNLQVSTGIDGLDRILKGIIPGDNIVWQVGTAEDYQLFIEPYVQFALGRGKDLIYFRFARHAPLVQAAPGVQMIELNPEEGFEAFVDGVHSVIRRNRRGSYYVFDCLSDLAQYWYSDQMLGNFFMLTCPYLLDVEAIAYFALYRNFHSFHATAPILETTQIFSEVYRHSGKMYIQPVKVLHRYSPTMYMLHVWEGEHFLPVTQSATISDVLTSVPWLQLSSSEYELGVWNRTFFEAEEVLYAIRKGDITPEESKEPMHRLIRMAISRDERVSKLVEKYLSLEELLAVGRRIIGTGLIGGKTVGMLLSRAILRQSDERWAKVLEPHDSFYIGSDVFYTFLVKNGIWWERERQKDSASFLEGSARARQRMLVGVFPEYVEKEINDLLDYFGQSPFIVRSSSLLEDNFGNAFAGKYESVFCVNQGPRDKRLEDFKTAIKTIYASSMSEKALTYRFHRGLLDRDEQMALLVQRVSGQYYDRLFMPQIAGVGFSFNPFVWNESIDPRTGVLRLVFGLGTRAVDRRDDDYTRIVALNAPQLRPESSQGERRQYTQKKVDVLDFDANQLVPYDFQEVIRRNPDLPVDLFASRDPELEQMIRERGRKDIFPWTLTFDKLLTRTGFVEDMRTMLRTIHQAYDYPVDIEFTCNFFDEEIYKINLVQCRPFQVKGGGNVPEPPQDIPESDLILKAHGAIIGQSRFSEVDWFVYVVPSAYSQLPLRDRYTVAKLIGQLMHVESLYQGKTIMLLGPGRWGTTSPELGVPISFSDINTVSILCEIVAMRADLVPDVSLGTHLFSDLVEMDILYMALFPEKENNYWNEAFLEEQPNLFETFLPEEKQWAGVVRVIDGRRQAWINANTLKQHVVCYCKNK